MIDYMIYVVYRFNQAVEIALKEFIHEREARLKRVGRYSA